MRGEKPKRLGRMQAGRFVETSARLQVAHRGPGVLRVPDDGRERAERERREEQIDAAPFEFAAQPRDEREHEHDRDQLERIRVFAKKPEANEQTGRGPEPGKIWTALKSEPESVERRHP